MQQLALRCGDRLSDGDSCPNRLAGTCRQDCGGILAGGLSCSTMKRQRRKERCDAVTSDAVARCGCRSDVGCRCDAAGRSRRRSRLADDRRSGRRRTIYRKSK